MKTNPKLIEQRLSTAIPLQSSPVQVLDYLNQQKIEHSEYLRTADAGNTIKAVVRDRSRWALVKSSYTVIFQFDEHDRLTAYQVRTAYTGP